MTDWVDAAGGDTPRSHRQGDLVSARYVVRPAQEANLVSVGDAVFYYGRRAQQWIGLGTIAIVRRLGEGQPEVEVAVVLEVWLYRPRPDDRAESGAGKDRPVPRSLFRGEEARGDYVFQELRRRSAATSAREKGRGGGGH